VRLTLLSRLENALSFAARSQKKSNQHSSTISLWIACYSDQPLSCHLVLHR